MIHKVDIVSEVAAAVADGHAIDWNRVESSATDEAERIVLRRLRAVASIGRFCTEVASAPEDTLSGSTTQASVEPATVASTWGSLRIIERVGSGRFGDVYRAWDPALDREVALKILRAGTNDPADTDVVEEGRLMARVRHPNVVTIHGAQRLNGVTGLWMEFVNGRTLAAELADRGRFSAQELTRVGLEVCRALGAVHDAHLVHRDVKAQNVLRGADGRIVLGDFGIGRELQDCQSTGGSLAGTPTHLAPELFQGTPPSPQSDLYSLGVLLFHLATDAFPVRGRHLRELRDAHTRGVRTNLQSLRPDLPRGFCLAIDRALDPAPANRFPDAAAMAAALESSVATVPSRARAVGRWTSIGLAILLISSMAAWWLQSKETKPIAFATRDWVLVTAFDNRTGEGRFDGALDYVLKQELANSNVVNVVGRSRVNDALVLMRKPLDTRLDASTGREVALRDGAIRALIVSRVDTISDRYSITADVTNPRDGSAVATVREASIAADDVVAAVRRIGFALRRTLGDMLPQLPRGGDELAKVVTPSLRALQLFSQARAMTGEIVLFNGHHFVRFNGSSQAIEQLLRDALTDDPDFVWAHILLAQALKGRHGTGPDVLAHLSRAVASAEVGTLDRYVAEAELFASRAFYASQNDEKIHYLQQAAGRYEAALQLRPDHLWSLECLMNISVTLQRYPEPQLIERYLSARPKSTGNFDMAVEASVAVGDWSSAREYARRGSQIDPLDSLGGFYGNAAANLRLFTAREALFRRDAAQALIEADRIANDPRSRQKPMNNRMGLKLADLYFSLGRLDRVEQVASWIEPPLSGNRLRVIAAMEREDPDALRRLLHQLYPTLRDVLGGHGGLNSSVSAAFVQAGMLDGARRLLPMTRPLGALSTVFEGQIAIAEGRTAYGVNVLQRVISEPLGQPQAWIQRRASIELADYRVRHGNYLQAITLLEAATQTRITPFEELLPEYMHLRERLAQAYRGAGRVTEAEAIEADLRRLLAVAENSHPMKIRLTGLAGEPGPRQIEIPVPTTYASR